jgi:hypothetical protein
MGIMSVKINADNGVVSGSGGYKLDPDASGVLELQTNGVTGIILDGSQNTSISKSLVFIDITKGIQFADGSTQLKAGASTGKAIAMAMIFGG